MSHLTFPQLWKCCGKQDQKARHLPYSVSGMTRDLPLRFLTSYSRHGVHGGVSFRTELAKTRVDSRRRRVMQQEKTLRSRAQLPQKIHKFSTAAHQRRTKDLIRWFCIFVVIFMNSDAAGC